MQGLQKNTNFSSVGPASWRSNGSSSNSCSSASPYPTPYCYPRGAVVNNYGGGIDPLTFMLLSQHNHPYPSYDLHKEQQEIAKDQLFIKENPDFLKKQNPKGKGTFWGSVAAVAAAFLTKGIEVKTIKDGFKEKIKLNTIKQDIKNLHLNFDPLLLLFSAGAGLIVGLITTAAVKSKVRTERLMRDEANKVLSKEEVNATEQNNTKTVEESI